MYLSVTLRAQWTHLPKPQGSSLRPDVCKGIPATPAAATSVRAVLFCVSALGGAGAHLETRLSEGEAQAADSGPLSARPPSTPRPERKKGRRKYVRSCFAKPQKRTLYSLPMLSGGETDSPGVRRSPERRAEEGAVGGPRAKRGRGGRGQSLRADQALERYWSKVNIFRFSGTAFSANK